MSRTDKDAPYRVRLERNEVGNSGNYGSESSNFRHARKRLKRQGHKNVRNGKTKFWDTQTVRTAIYYY